MFTHPRVKMARAVYANPIAFAKWRCYERNFNPLYCLPSRTYSTGRPQVGLCPKFLVFVYCLESTVCKFSHF